MNKKNVLFSLFVLFISFSLNAKLPPQTDLIATKQQSKTIVNLVEQLRQGHYRELKFDDDLSKRFTEKYLESLDPNKMYFYQRDIEQILKHQTHFDDYFKKGQLTAGFDIYRLYRSRVISRLESVIALLEDDTITFSFDKDDNFIFDRSEMPYPETKEDADELWYKHIKSSLLNQKLSDENDSESASDSAKNNKSDSLPKNRKTLAKRYNNQLNRVKQQTSADAFEKLANSLTLLFDPHTNYLSPRTTENFNINMSLSLEGIGAVLQSEDEFTKVTRLVPGGPAAKQGELKAADKIIGVGQGEDGEMIDITSWRLDEVVDKIRGPKNTVVRLEVIPKNEVEGVTRIIKIRRDEVQLEDQAAKHGTIDIPDGNGDIMKIGVIYLPAFYRNFDQANKLKPDFRSSTRDVHKLLNKLKAESVDGIILDLRNNGGGSLQEATMLTDLFIDQGTVVQIRTPDGYINRHNQARRKAVYRGPLVVLVNRFSASASEIFAGAIQDYQRGLVIGTQTFGKGTVQSVKRTVEGMIKLTESKFYRVSGESTQHRGVVPDINFPSILDFELVGESAYDNALPWDTIMAVPHAKYIDIQNFIAPLKLLHQKRILTDPDFIYFSDYAKLANKNKDRKSVSLNEKVRRKENIARDDERTLIENKLRVSKGQKPFPNAEAYKKHLKEKEKEKENTQNNLEHSDLITGIDEDAELLESGNILVDYIQLMKRRIAMQTAKDKAQHQLENK